MEFGKCLKMCGNVSATTNIYLLLCYITLTVNMKVNEKPQDIFNRDIFTFAYSSTRNLEIISQKKRLIEIAFNK